LALLIVDFLKKMSIQILDFTKNTEKDEIMLKIDGIEY
jgi:hypothetical protein